MGGPHCQGDLLVPGRHEGDSGRDAGSRHQDHARHEDHADVLEARAKGAGQNLPPVTPHKAGAWHEINSHTIQFVPQGYGYGLGADVRVSLPEGVNLVGGQARGSDPIGQWTVPDGSTLALQQLLARARVPAGEIRPLERRHRHGQYPGRRGGRDREPAAGHASAGATQIRRLCSRACGRLPATRN